MFKLHSVCLLTVLLLFLAACQKEAPQPWIPVLEQTSFTYLDDVVAELRLDVDQATGHLRSGLTDRASLALKQTNHVLLKLQQYFLPMTEVRQLIYDADRIYYLGDKVATHEKLRLGKDQLVLVGSIGGKTVTKAVDDAIQMLEKLDLAIDTDPGAVTEKMRLLGEKINLMILKGDLILSGVKFPQEK